MLQDTRINNKKKKKKKPAQQPTVSIVTINQLKRRATIVLLFQQIHNQTYQKITEWVIVEGSPTEEEASQNSGWVNDLISQAQAVRPELQIRYLSAFSPDGVFQAMKLGALRNLGNQACTGDITVCMDDDDYYFPTRVAHCVDKLQQSSCLIAGCSAKYMYDYDLKALFVFKIFGPNHATNDTMAWKRDYLLKHSHDPNAGNAEESSFTNQFQEPMVQLEAAHCLVSSSHSHNTYSKKEICVLTTMGLYPNAVALDETLVQSLMPGQFHDSYSGIFRKNVSCEYDVVYFTGGTSIKWDPRDLALGGSEQAVVHLSQNWVQLGQKVAVYGNFALVYQESAGVHYYHWSQFNYCARYRTLILWRMAGVHGCLPFPVQTERLFLDLHDNFYTFRIDYSKYAAKIDKIFFKSQYHVRSYCQSLNCVLPTEKFVVIPNGIRVQRFQKTEHTTRNPYRFVYCSNYTRGLYELLVYVWPEVYRHEPRAELHVYYGMQDVDDIGFKQKILTLLAQPGVMDHGRMPVDLVAREKKTATFHLYVTNTTTEIDCISIRESLVSGCIPLISKFGVFAERDGVHIPLDGSSQSDYKPVAPFILSLIRNPNLVAKLRTQLETSDTISDWSTVASKWMEQFY
jgi:glycosyltransferase involved in cell wall biosynthesis